MSEGWLEENRYLLSLFKGPRQQWKFDCAFIRDVHWFCFLGAERILVTPTVSPPPTELWVPHGLSLVP